MTPGRVAALLAIPLWLGACAGAPPTTDTAPAPATEPAVAETMPLEWFVENWGPFDVTRVGMDGSRQLPLVLIDGEQLYRRSLVDVDAPADMPTREEIRHIRIVKSHSGAGLFGEAACAGIIMVFTHEYDGPMPITRKLADPPDCRRGRP